MSRYNLLPRRDVRSRPRGSYRKANDEGLLPLIRRFVDERPIVSVQPGPFSRRDD